MTADSSGSMGATSDNDDAGIRARANELVEQMTPEEKAGQLTQYFYFGFMRDLPAETSDGANTPNQPDMVEEALSEGRAGSLLFVTDPGETNRLQKQAVEGSRLGIPLLFCSSDTT